MSNNLSIYYRLPLKTLILSERNKNIKFIHQNYGQLGVDIFQNEKKPSILTKKDNKKFNKIINNIKKFFGFIGKEDYKESDSLHNVMFKYLYNNKQGTEAEIENLFGKKGMELFNVFKLMGYIK